MNTRSVTAEEIAENVASIEAVPQELWASGHDRTFALHWARRGYDCYAYRAVGGIWNLWLEDRRIRLDGPPSRARLDELQRMRARITVERQEARDSEQVWERWRLAVAEHRAQQARQGREG
ncbi:MAG TPA: hypothetical protein VFU72_08820 [Nitrolancea sp.]|nr:hypothetical protein [Nitrolancea sp.]